MEVWILDGGRCRLEVSANKCNSSWRCRLVHFTCRRKRLVGSNVHFHFYSKKKVGIDSNRLAAKEPIPCLPSHQSIDVDRVPTTSCLSPVNNDGDISRNNLYPVRFQLIQVTLMQEKMPRSVPPFPPNTPSVDLILDEGVSHVFPPLSFKYLLDIRMYPQQ